MKLEKIEHDSLFLERAKSFSQYVRQLAEQFQVHESNLWRIKKAGEYYLKLHDTNDVQVIEKAKTTPEQVEILSKISTAAPPEVVQSLEKRMVDGQNDTPRAKRRMANLPSLKEGRTERGRKPNIEITTKYNRGIVAYANDEGGIIWEGEGFKDLDKAIEALEKGIGSWYDKHMIE